MQEIDNLISETQLIKKARNQLRIAVVVLSLVILGMVYAAYSFSQESKGLKDYYKATKKEVTLKLKEKDATIDARNISIDTLRAQVARSQLRIQDNMNQRPSKYEGPEYLPNATPTLIESRDTLVSIFSGPLPWER